MTTTQEAHSALALVVVLHNAGESIPPELLNMAGMIRPPETLPELRTRYASEGDSAKIRFVDSLIAGTPDHEALRECGGYKVQVNNVDLKPESEPKPGPKSSNGLWTE